MKLTAVQKCLFNILNSLRRQKLETCSMIVKSCFLTTPNQATVLRYSQCPGHLQSQLIGCNMFKASLMHFVPFLGSLLSLNLYFISTPKFKLDRLNKKKFVHYQTFFITNRYLGIVSSDAHRVKLSSTLAPNISAMLTCHKK